MTSIRRWAGGLLGRRPRRTAAPPSMPVPEEAKASRVGRLIALQSPGEPRWTPRNLVEFAREGYMRNPIVYRSVRMLAEGAASVPLLLYEGEREVDAHTILDLLARPNARQSGTDLLQACYSSLLVTGNAYLEAVAVGGRVRELHLLRADRMRVVPGLDGWPDAYEYTVSGETFRYRHDPAVPVRPILHLTLFHPLDDHYGMSPIEAAATAIDVHNAASGWNKALLDNSARPSGALVYTARDGRLTPEQYARLKAELESSFESARNAGRPMLLEGGLDWKSMSLSPLDMDFIQLKSAAARDIALALGVPPMLLGIPGDNTYSNYVEANRTFWRQSVVPLAERVARALSGWLATGPGEALELRPDLDAIAALGAEREALWSRLKDARYLTVNEKRAAIGYGPIADGDRL